MTAARVVTRVGARVRTDDIHGTVTRVGYADGTGANQTELIYVNWHVPALDAPVTALAGSCTR